jgi:hypothetical protein
MSLKEELENSLLLRLCGAFAAGVALGWLVSQNIQVSPRDRDIAVLKQRVDEKEKTINYLNAQDEPYRKQISQLLADQELLQKQANTMKELLETYNKSTDNNFSATRQCWSKGNEEKIPS